MMCVAKRLEWGKLLECVSCASGVSGNVASLEAVKQAFRAAWDRRPKAR